MLLFLSLQSEAQSEIYLQNLSDTTKQHSLRLNRYYKIFSNQSFHEKIRLISFTDTSLTFLQGRNPNEMIHLHFSEIKYMDNTPKLVGAFAHIGGIMILVAPVFLVASPLIGIFDGWENAREAVEFSGILAGGGLVLASPTFLFKRYPIGKKWKIIIK